MPLSLKQQLKLNLSTLVARVTRNRLTFVFFLFGFFHCFAQGIIQSFQFTLDNEYSSFLTSITTAAGIPSRNHTDVRFQGDRYTLKLCNDIPHNDKVCSYIYDSNQDLVTPNGPTTNSEGRGLIVKQMISTHNVTLVASDKPETNNVTLVLGPDRVELSSQCVKMLLLPAQRTQNARREDVAFVVLQFWLFGIALMAMIRDSVPHVLAGLGARLILTAWSVYALWRAGSYRGVYYHLIEQAGSPCSVKMFAEYFDTRHKYEIIDAILNCTALAISVYLSFALLKRYNSESFNFVGAPPQIVRIHRYFMAVKVCLQLEAFVLLAASGMWTDQVFNTYIRDITYFFKLWVGIFISWTIVLIPWIILGWYGIRYEHRTVTNVFITAAFVFLVCSSVMFYSEVYRWTYYAWPNFACYVTASLILLLASFVLGILCRINFGKGLSQYLHAEAALASSHFAPEVFEHDVEKKNPSAYIVDPFEQAIPTFHTINLPVR